MKYYKIYGIFKIKKDGTILGYTENSFSMSWNENTVRKYYPRDIKYVFDNNLISNYNIEYGDRIVVIRISAKNLALPIELDWKHNVENNDRKFYRRNIKFKPIEKALDN